MRLNVYLAWRLLIARPTSLLFMVAAVAFGLAFQWPNQANISGYSREMMTRFVERGLGHYRLFHKEEKFFRIDSAREALAPAPGVVRIDPRVRLNGLVTRVARRRTAAGVVFLGIDAEEWRAMQSGIAASPDAAPRALVGSELAKRLDFKKGDRVQILFMVDGRPLLRTIRPVVVSGYGYVTEQQIILRLDDVQRWIGRSGRASEIAVLQTRPPAPGEAVFQPKAPYRTRAWWRTVDFARQAIAGNTVLALITAAMTLIGISIPLLALLYMSVVQDREHIALMASMGFSRARLFFVYFLRSSFIALLGCGGGAAIGYGLIRYFMAHPIYSTAGFVIRPELNTNDLLLSLGVVFGVTLLSGLFPALRAAALDPVVILRGTRA